MVCTLCPFTDNLYYVFVNIRDDEAEHCKTMKACQTHGNLPSPHSYEDGFEDMPDCMIPEADCVGTVNSVNKSFTTTQVKQKSRQLRETDEMYRVQENYVVPIYCL
ncbi:hypothetical protein V6N13_059217 [Hibiscus sabdariffa]|uniref:Ubiquinol oxidase (non-electrogenic) n=1 Tax=Hibiscus sabdariffa TaxID=183260 RepID=A0ABR2GDP0_9ROSI